MLYQCQSADADDSMDTVTMETVWGSMRVLCAWLAEETEAMRKEVCAVLPYLLSWCRPERGYVMCSGSPVLFPTRCPQTVWF